MSVTRHDTALEVFDRIVCGVDGTAEALEAARQSARLRAPDGELTIAAVADIDAAVHAGWAMASVLDELDAAARNALHRAVDEVTSAKTELLAGGVVPCLLDEIERTNATLLAVGPRGHSRLTGMLLGGVGTELLHRTPCSVLFAREPRFGEFPSSILVGLDGSPASLAAARVAEALATRFGAERVIVAATGGKAIDLPRVQAHSPYVIADPGQPVDALVGLSLEADLVVVGSRGLHGLRALGSVSERVAHRAGCSVLVVREEKEES